MARGARQSGLGVAYTSRQRSRIAKGDFVLVPADPGFTIASDLACEVVSIDMEGALHCQADGVRYGDSDLALEFKQLGGNFELVPGIRAE
jgi:hypothetical protein